MLRHQLRSPSVRPRAHSRLTCLDRAWLALRPDAADRPPRLDALIVTPAPSCAGIGTSSSPLGAPVAPRRSGRPRCASIVLSVVCGWPGRTSHGLPRRIPRHWPFSLTGSGVDGWRLKSAGIETGTARDWPGCAEFLRSQALGSLALDCFHRDPLNGAKILRRWPHQHGTRRVGVSAPPTPVAGLVVHRTEPALWTWKSGRGWKFVLHDRDQSSTAGVRCCVSRAAGVGSSAPRRRRE